MRFICIKYSGLQFNYIFETNTFVFIPRNEVGDREIFDAEFFSCNFEMDSEFYVLLKEPFNIDLTIEAFSEEYLNKFKLLEALLNLLFSNYFTRDYIFILEKENSSCTVQKAFKPLSTKSNKINRPLLWKDAIFTKFLQEIIDKAFERYNSITKKEDFAQRYAFSVDMYLSGKFGENRLRNVSDLWISLEVLSDITISNILHSHGTFQVDDFFSEVQDMVNEYAVNVPPENIDCWSPLKENFSDHIKNKITKTLPIFQKCVKVAEQYLDIDIIKIKLPDLTNSSRSQEEQDIIREFRDFQEWMTIKKVLRKIYEERNALFHRGKISEKWSLKFDRIKSNFIKILEQLFFQVLDLNMVKFYQMGYPYQKVFGLPINEGEFNNLGDISQLSRIYMHKEYIEPLHTNYINPFDYSPVREKYIMQKHGMNLCRTHLKDSEHRILTFLNKSHPIKLLSDGLSFNDSLKYWIIKDKIFSFELDSKINIYTWDKRQVIIKNQDITDISSIFLGMFNLSEVKHSVDLIIAPFKINPPYISFKFN